MRMVCSPGLPDLFADGYATALPVFRFLATLRQPMYSIPRYA